MFFSFASSCWHILRLKFTAESFKSTHRIEEQKVLDEFLQQKYLLAIYMGLENSTSSTSPWSPRCSFIFENVFFLVGVYWRSSFSNKNQSSSINNLSWLFQSYICATIASIWAKSDQLRRWLSEGNFPLSPPTPLSWRFGIPAQVGTIVVGCKLRYKYSTICLFASVDS